ncbi:hypothetical protein FGG78_10245 [Thioclava sp. BHET1]|nr:hypothetical protein FGG78_10245 [Thioclava sp. BHET1]
MVKGLPLRQCEHVEKVWGSGMSGLLGYGFCLLAVLGVIASQAAWAPALARRGSLPGAAIALGAAILAAIAAGSGLALYQASSGQDAGTASLFTLLALVSVGVLLFGGKPALQEALGIALALGSMLLMARIV